MTKTEYLAKVKSHLRNKKSEWFMSSDLVDGKAVLLKFYGKSIQRLVIDGQHHGGLYDIPTQKKMIEYISDAIG